MPLQATSGAASYDAFGGGVPVVPAYIEEVFSTYLYTGNGSTQTITNGIDLSTNGGLVWVKCRDITPGYDHVIYDTARGTGTTKALYTDTANAQGAFPDYQNLTAFNSNGFSVGTTVNAANLLNTNNGKFVSWTFRKQPKFFDIVTWTGNDASNRAISHSLNSVPGSVIFKSTSNTQDWYVYHRTQPTKQWYLNQISGNENANDNFGSSAFTSTDIYVGGNLNISGRTYVAYIFAHNAGGFGLTGTDNVITCDSVTTNGSGVFSVNLGYEPQWVLFKKATAGTAGNSNWFLLDNMRGWSNTNQVYLYPNLSDAEYNQSGSYVVPTATGFQSIQTGVLDSSSTYIYIAIRRGPMKVPTSGTSVYSNAIWSGNGTGGRIISSSPVTPSLLISRHRNGEAGTWWIDKLRGRAVTFTSHATAGDDPDVTAYLISSFNQTGVTFTSSPIFINNSGGSTYVGQFLARAPGFFDEVCYTGDGGYSSYNHNLTVVPEMMIVKARSTTSNWSVYHSALGLGNYVRLNTTAASAGTGDFWYQTPTTTQFSVGGYTEINDTGVTYVAYLFATCAGVSKVGSYTGTATTKQIDCGFTGGARFVLIKRTDSTGDWYVWDTARGIVSGNDPYLLLNSTAAEVTNTDYIDTYSAGFEISSSAPSAINASGGTFIFLAIA